MRPSGKSLHPEQTITLTLDPKTEQYLAEEAKRGGFASPDALVTHPIEQHRTRSTRTMSKEKLMKTDAWKAIQKVKGIAKGRMSADQIMAETRSDA